MTCIDESDTFWAHGMERMRWDGKKEEERGRGEGGATQPGWRPRAPSSSVLHVTRLHRAIGMYLLVAQWLREGETGEERGSWELEAAPSRKRRQHWARLQILVVDVLAPQSTSDHHGVLC